MRTLKTGPIADEKCQFCNRPKPVIWELHERYGTDTLGWLPCCGTLLVEGIEAIYAFTPRKSGGHPNHNDLNEIIDEVRALETLQAFEAKQKTVEPAMPGRPFSVAQLLGKKDDDPNRQ